MDILPANILTLIKENACLIYGYTHTYKIITAQLPLVPGQSPTQAKALLIGYTNNGKAKVLSICGCEAPAHSVGAAVKNLYRRTADTIARNTGQCTYVSWVDVALGEVGIGLTRFAGHLWVGVEFDDADRL
jgi:hypothetical protein